jgi:hypothetical protein
VACAQVAKKPDHKSGCVNRPADTFGICQSTPARFSAARHQPRRPPLAKIRPGRQSSATPWLKRIASSHCSLMTSKGNSRANGISERESNNQPDCEDDQGIGHGVYRVPSSITRRVSFLGQLKAALRSARSLEQQPRLESQHYQRCRQTQNCRCKKCHRVGRHLREKLGHLSRLLGGGLGGASALIVAPCPKNTANFASSALTQHHPVTRCKAPPGHSGGAPGGDFCCSDAEATYSRLPRAIHPCTRTTCCRLDP